MCVCVCMCVWLPAARVWLYNDLTENPTLQYLAWISLPVFLVLFSSGFVHIMAPQAIGESTNRSPPFLFDPTRATQIFPNTTKKINPFPVY